MTATQSNKLAMYHAVRVFLTGFLNSTTATSQFPVLAAKLAALITLLDKIIGHATTQARGLTLACMAREQALGSATTATLGIAGALHSYALTHDKPDLAKEAQVTASTFSVIRRSERMILGQRIHDLAEPLQAELADFGVTAAKLTACQTLIDAAAASVDVRASAGAAKKVATAEIERLGGEVDTLLTSIDSMLVQLEAIDPESYALYHAARAVFDLPGARVGATEAMVPAAPAAPSATAPAERQAA